MGSDGEKLRKQGHEFGTTTGRPRRCGWFDAVATRYASRLNGCDELAVMKLDVLDGFEEIKVCIAYEIDGQEIDYLPENLDNAKPVYKIFKGWEKSVGARSMQELPKEAQEYIAFIEEITKTKVGIVSTSPEREDTIILS
jgi:adenylosuccinate synthase